MSKRNKKQRTPNFNQVRAYSKNKEKANKQTENLWVQYMLINYF